ncbi:MAG TPA: hypothetical protein VFR22_12105 [Nocardioidaceae bacterium]|nr:hypothetical protein [Nocardioidaceae bacterium]
MDLDSVAQELYGVPLPDFVPTRNGRVKEARAAGDRELAAEIQALAKPTTAAWLVNQLSREHADDLTPLLDLGRELRDASAKLDGQTMRRLGRERTELVTQLVDHTRQLGSDRGSKVSDDVAEEVRRTLEATFSDAEIADEVSAGQLVRAVEYAGFGDLAGFGGPTGVVRDRKADQRSKPPRKSASERADRPAKRAEPPPSRPADLGVRRRQKAERELADAQQRLEAAQAARDEAQQEIETTTAEVERTEGEVERLRAELSTAEREAKSARHADRSAQQRLTRTERELAGIERLHDRAKDRLADLDD